MASPPRGTKPVAIAVQPEKRKDGRAVVDLARGDGCERLIEADCEGADIFVLAGDAESAARAVKAGLRDE